jgi:hypothetical protein
MVYFKNNEYDKSTGKNAKSTAWGCCLLTIMAIHLLLKKFQKAVGRFNKILD